MPHRPGYGLAVADLLALMAGRRKLPARAVSARDDLGARGGPGWAGGGSGRRGFGESAGCGAGLGRERLEQFGELRATWWVGRPEGGTDPALDPEADPLDDGAAVTGEVHEDTATVDGIVTAVGEPRGDQAVDDTGRGRRGERRMGGDLAHAPPAAAGEHQQYAPAVTADTFGLCGRDDGRRDGPVDPVEKLDHSGDTRRRHGGCCRRRSTR